MKFIYKSVKVLALLTSVIALFNCSDENLKEEQRQYAATSENEGADPRMAALYSSHHTMSEEQAKKLAMRAESFFSGKNNGLKSASINDVIVLKKRNKNQLKSLRELSSVIPDTTAYIINFAGNNGFAVIGADDRIGDPILAYIENGNYDNSQDVNRQKVIDGIQQYVENAIVSFERSRDSLMLVAEAYIRDNGIANEDFNSLKKSTLTPTLTFVGNKEVLPLCKTKWGQDSPYNDYIASEKGAKYPVGCGAVATAQIMAYWQVASPLSWSEILRGPRISDLTATGKQHLQILLLFVADGCKSKYNLDGTSTTFSDCAAYLRKSNLKTSTTDYSVNTVKTALDNKCPVIMRGTDTQSGDGHAWVVDGYKSTNYKIKILSINLNASENHFHYNWGWNGFCDGWYKSGIFAVNDYETRDGSDSYFKAKDDPDFSKEQRLLIVCK
ncbi:MAG: C10 family peptidase [Paludibacteraceae bacterium]|nr:C10 family peptidase [Paludibacteraceae bacterium]